jgi:hypothetical protein
MVIWRDKIILLRIAKLLTRFYYPRDHLAIPGTLSKLKGGSLLCSLVAFFCRAYHRVLLGSRALQTAGTLQVKLASGRKRGERERKERGGGQMSVKRGKEEQARQERERKERGEGQMSGKRGKEKQANEEEKEQRKR